MSENRRLAKNTIYLYIRMMLVMAVSIYTSRIVLAALGIVDYGIYNVVGSVVALFTFLQTAMGNASHRFIAYALGKKDQERLNKIFSTSIELHVLIAIVIVILSETVGLWFFYNKLNIPPDRLSAAMAVLQISIISCFMSICMVPYNAEIIAHEKMNFYAYLSIFDVFIKLVVAYFLTVITFDKLIWYALLLLLGQAIVFLVYVLYCRHHFTESRFRFVCEKTLFKEMASFAGWNLFGHMSATLSSQGRNMLLNIFFGPTLNAAKGVAQQVESALMMFVQNFLTAVGPQITKSYAINDKNRMHFLIFISTKVSFFMYVVIGLPLFFEIDQVLSVWLVEVPEYTSIFLRLLIIAQLSSAFFQPLNQSCMATGNARNFLMVRGFTAFVVLILTYVVFKVGAEPESMFVVQIVLLYVSVFIQLSIVAPLVDLSKWEYFKKVVLRLCLTLMVAVPVPFLIWLYMPANFYRFLIVCILSVISVTLTSFFIGLEKAEREMVLGLLKEKVPIMRKVL